MGWSNGCCCCTSGLYAAVYNSRCMDCDILFSGLSVIRRGLTLPSFERSSRLGDGYALRPAQLILVAGARGGLVPSVVRRAGSRAPSAGRLIGMAFGVVAENRFRCGWSGCKSVSVWSLSWS